MITKLKDKDLTKKIRAFIGKNDKHSLCELHLQTEYKKVVLFPTYDVYLNEKQFMALKSFLQQIDEAACYVLNYYTVLKDKGYQALTDHNIIYRVDSNTSYEEYTDLFLTEMSYIVSQNFNWFIAIEETKEDGVGIFVAKNDLIELFQKNYPQYSLDFEMLKDLANNTHNGYYKCIIK